MPATSARKSACDLPYRPRGLAPGRCAEAPPFRIHAPAEAAATVSPTSAKPSEARASKAAPAPPIERRPLSPQSAPQAPRDVRPRPAMPVAYGDPPEIRRSRWGPTRLSAVWCPKGLCPDGGTRTPLERGPTEERKPAGSRGDSRTRYAGRDFRRACAPRLTPQVRQRGRLPR